MEKDAGTSSCTPVLNLEVVSPALRDSAPEIGNENNTNEEMENIWKFLIEEMKKLTEPLKRGDFSSNIWEEYKEFTGSEKSSDELSEIFSRNSGTLLEHCTDVETIVKTLYVYQIPVGVDYLDKIKANGEAEVVLDDNRQIVSYSGKGENETLVLQDLPSQQENETETESGGSQDSQASEEYELEGALGESDAEDCKPDISKLSVTRQKFTEEEELEMWEFLYQQVRNPLTGKPEKNRVHAKGLNIWKEFRKIFKSQRGAHVLCARFRKLMASNLHETKLSNEKKLILYYGLDIKVNEDYLEKLRKSADVRIDNSGCITMYRKRVRVKEEEMSPNDELSAVKDMGNTEKSSKKRTSKRRKEDQDHDNEDSRNGEGPIAKTPRRRRSSRLAGTNNKRELKALIPPALSTLRRVYTEDETSFSKNTDKTPNLCAGDISDNSGESSNRARFQNSHHNTKEFLIQIKGLAVHLNSPHLDATLQKIEERIKSTSDTAELPMDRIQVILEATLAMIPY